MTGDDVSPDGFETHRPHLRTVAHRLLGSTADADDAVQETWVRFQRSDTAAVENLGGWLTTVVSRVSLDMLRARSFRREDAVGVPGDGDGPGIGTSVEPEDEALLADSVSAALLIVLDTLRPTERLAFVLHDLFAVPFDEIGVILDRSPAAAKQLASRARRKVQGTDQPPAAERDRQREVVDAFLAASRGGDLAALIALLAPDIVLGADAVAVTMGASGELRGAAEVAGTFSGRALGAQPALVAGELGMVWMVDGRPKVAWDFLFDGDTVVGIDMLADPDTLAHLGVAALD